MAEQKTAKILELLDHIARELDSMHAQFSYRSDAETQALKLSPEPQEVLDVIEEGIKDDSEATPGLKQKLSEQVAAVKARITDESTATEEPSLDRDESTKPDNSA